MTDLVVQPFDPARAADGDLEGYYQVLVASQASERPDQQRLTYDVAVGRLTNPFPGLGPVAWWLARERGSVVGAASAHFPEAENSQLGLVEVVVHPAARRRGIGTAMLDALLPELRARGRTLVEGWQILSGCTGERWATALGFRPVRTIVTQTLVLAGAPRSSWPAKPPAGYRLHQWLGPAPDDLVEAYADARSAIHDAPIGESAFRPPDWTADRVREVEADLRRQHIEQRVVIAAHERTGIVAGLTEVIVHPHRPDHAYQGDTAVRPAHRGRGLGLCLKARMARWLLSDHPGLDRIQTTTSGDNTHMIRVNHQFGFTTSHTYVAMSLPVDG